MFCCCCCQFVAVVFVYLFACCVCGVGWVGGGGVICPNFRLICFLLYVDTLLLLLFLFVYLPV